MSTAGPSEAGSGARRRGQRHIAVAVAGDPRRAEEARKALEDATYARTARGPRESRLATLESVASASGVSLYPPSAAGVKAVAAALKEAGYKAGAQYLSDWKVESRRKGHELEAACAQAFEDAARAVARDTRPEQRSKPLRPELVARIPDEPTRDCLLVCCWWLLREAEARALSRKDVAFDRTERRVALRLTSSKTDPEGRGASRTLSCTCAAAGPAWRVLCPYHACRRLRGASRANRCEGLMPGPGGARWKQGHLAKLLRRWATLLDAGQPADGRWGGHSCRRGGAQWYHRMGMHLSTTKHMGRWGSSAVYRYIEEVEVDAADVAPRAVRALVQGAR